VLTGKLAFTPYLEDRDEVVTRALNTRRDLLAIRLEAQASEYQLRAQSANDRPLLYLDGTLAWQGETSDGFFPGDRESAESASLGLTFAWPLLDGFRNRSLTKQARAGLKLARLAVKQAEDMVKLEVRSNWSDALSIAEEITAAERTVEVAQEAYEIAQVRYDTGLSTLIEFLDAELALIQSTLALKETLYRYNVAIARLEYSIGEGPNLEGTGGED
jgi:outer membrane protein TolC